MIDIDSFASRHIGPRDDEIKEMLNFINCSSLDDLIKKTVPQNILSSSNLNLKPGMSEDFNKINMQFYIDQVNDLPIINMINSIAYDSLNQYYYLAEDTTDISFQLFTNQCSIYCSYFAISIYQLTII